MYSGIKSLVEIPDAGDDVLREERGGHCGSSPLGGGRLESTGVSQSAERGWCNSQIFPLTILPCLMDTLPELARSSAASTSSSAQMAEPSFYANQRRAAEVTREQQKLRTMVDDHQVLRPGRRASSDDAMALAAEASGGIRASASSRAPRSPGSSAGRASCARPCSSP
jgi:hypothetical protein